MCKTLVRNRVSALFLLIAFFLSSSLHSQDQPAATKPIDPQSIIAFLNQTLVWYRQLTNQQQLANEPSDILFLNDNRQLADQIVRLSFEFARAEAAVLAKNGQSGATENAIPNRYQSLLDAANRADQSVKQTQADLDSLRRKLDSASGKTRNALEANIAETQSELELQQARRDAIRSMVTFASGTNAAGLGSGSLQSEIEELARTAPVAMAQGNGSAATTNGNTGSPASSAAEPPPSKVQLNTSAERKVEPSGILGLITDLMSLHRKMEELDESSALTDTLANNAKSLRAPLVANVRELAKRGDQLANQPDSQDPAVVADQRKQIDALTAQFKSSAATVLPLGKQSILLDLYKRSILSWHNSVESQYKTELKSLILRLVILGMVLAVIATISEIWRRATFRYVRDARRRYQFLLLRRILVWTLVAVIVAIAFATELSTLATFAGLLTAGVAVALQNVILSVAGYFFLIGKYGVRVGDRVQIAGVTGDVVDIGLVRLHIMEVATQGVDARATGRVVVFSNAVVFQPSAGLFKQIPGTNFVWHDIALTLAPDSDYQQVEERLMSAVNAVFEKYRDAMETQRRRMEQALTVTVKPLGPESRLRLTQGGLGVVIRYPVELVNAAAIDDAMARALLDAISRSPRLKLVGSSAPNLQAVPETTPPAG